MGLMRNLKIFISISAPFSQTNPHHLYSQHRTLVKVRLKWVKNRGLDHIIDTETDLKAACLIKDAIKRSSHGYLSSRILSDRQKPLGLTIPVIRFMRRYPTLFHEFPDPKYNNLPCFRLTDTALFLDDQEQAVYRTHESDSVERLSRFLMMSNSKPIPFQSLLNLKWDLGLPDDYIKTLIPKYPDHFRITKRQDGLSCLNLAQWPEEFAVSTLQKNAEITNSSTDTTSGNSSEYRNFKKGTSLAFPMSFPRGYGAQKKVIAWMDDFQKLPYISPYEDSSQIDPTSDLMEKHVVGVLHELLSLTIHKKTKRNYLRCLREELNLPHKFTRIFTRYPGIFYLSLKCKTTTVTLKEAYRRGKLVDLHPLARIREKYYYVMRTGVMYRGKGLTELERAKLDAVNDGEDQMEQQSEEDIETGDEYYPDDGSDVETGSDEE
ncbi:protein WHAT'S THIS FACTOR 9, mitochondrial-like [Tasmannia lanceolata]|uniref:protein WHAT'S THIS FACTOR 9, mitochondrial-like n=1 Tax=Tasmannia lanceolata TaxID=3420 RepID=UPI004064495A